MKNSYIIKNADPSFETYYNSMKKRTKTYQQLNASVPATQNLFTSLNPDSQLQGLVSGKRPAARDGHTGIVVNETFLVFGGDRHHMPFNDLYLLDLKRHQSLQ